MSEEGEFGNVGWRAIGLQPGGQRGRRRRVKRGWGNDGGDAGVGRGAGESMRLSDGDLSRSDLVSVPRIEIAARLVRVGVKDGIYGALCSQLCADKMQAGQDQDVINLSQHQDQAVRCGPSKDRVQGARDRSSCKPLRRYEGEPI